MPRYMVTLTDEEQQELRRLIQKKDKINISVTDPNLLKMIRAATEGQQQKIGPDTLTGFARRIGFPDQLLTTI